MTYTYAEDNGRLPGVVFPVVRILRVWTTMSLSELQIRAARAGNVWAIGATRTDHTMSSYAPWKSIYSVGDESIDSQHKQILALISDLHTAIEENGGFTGLEEPLDRLVAYTMTHFRNEEHVMKACSFPDFQNHKALHDQMRRRTEELRKNITLVTPADLLRFLKDWWTNHIRTDDQCYVPYISVANRNRSSAAPTPSIGPIDWRGQTPTHR
jgi:hemerythrin